MRASQVVGEYSRQKYSLNSQAEPLSLVAQQIVFRRAIALNTKLNGGKSLPQRR
jgi:hypothetical protein